MRAWNRWLGFLARVEPGTSLALFRIACGIGVVITIGGVLGHDLVDVIWVSSEHGGVRRLARSPWLVEQLGGATPGVVQPLAWASMIGGVLLALGIGGRPLTFVTLQLFLAVTDINTQAGGSYDELLGNALWLLVLARADQTLSIRCRLRTGRWNDPTPVAAWPRYLGIFQLVLAYGSTGLQKLSAHWTPIGGYSAIYYILQQPSWHRFDMTWLAPYYPLTQLATALSWFWEVSAPLLLLALYYRHTADRPGRLRALFNRLRWREGFVLIGVGLHLSVFALMEVGPFTWVTLAFYLCLYDPEEWQQGWVWILDRLER